MRPGCCRAFSVLLSFPICSRPFAAAAARYLRAAGDAGEAPVRLGRRHTRLVRRTQRLRRRRSNGPTVAAGVLPATALQQTAASSVQRRLCSRFPTRRRGSTRSCLTSRLGARRLHPVRRCRVGPSLPPGLYGAEIGVICVELETLEACFCLRRLKRRRGVDRREQRCQRANENAQPLQHGQAQGSKVSTFPNLVALSRGN
jgi:hypothetical protein